ncbi:hypothetical protein C8F04DRAFT_134755 [Mycena alexandri]|uniref:Uncharacterized protein n=1 Tax=Mycena alexandri TaxID=1745969 RepID=A0AAD6WW25_9AGAR|nr:hypothetical protein C8F04DRAFT_134755 [Mycena alexandri]
MSAPLSINLPNDKFDRLCLGWTPSLLRSRHRALPFHLLSPSSVPCSSLRAQVQMYPLKTPQQPSSNTQLLEADSIASYSSYYQAALRRHRRMQHLPRRARNLPLPDEMELLDAPSLSQLGTQFNTPNANHHPPQLNAVSPGDSSASSASNRGSSPTLIGASPGQKAPPPLRISTDVNTSSPSIPCPLTPMSLMSSLSPSPPPLTALGKRRGEDANEDNENEQQKHKRARLTIKIPGVARELRRMG